MMTPNAAAGPIADKMLEIFLTLRVSKMSYKVICSKTKAMSRPPVKLQTFGNPEIKPRVLPRNLQKIRCGFLVVFYLMSTPIMALR